MKALGSASPWLFATLTLVACATSSRPVGPAPAPSAAPIPGASALGSPAPVAGGGLPSAEAASTVAPEAQTETSTEADADAAAPVPNSLPADMLPVPGGTFVMGADNEGEQDERPAHAVTVAPFLLDRTEVTNAAYAECVSAGACQAPDSLIGSALAYGQPKAFHEPEKPAVGVSWFDAQAYCRFRGKRLPREAEWERAARGSDGRRYVWGSEAPDPKRHGVFGGRQCTERVGSYPDGRGPYGHLDLAGNAWEWVVDLYDPYAYRRASAGRGEPGSCEEILETLAELRRQHKQGFTGKNPIPSQCERVLRGAAYNYGVSGVRASNRVHHPASFRIAVPGFRCAADAPQ